MTAPVVIVGAGLAGLRTAEELRRAGFAGELVLIGDEAHPPYDRPPLSKQFVRGETDDTALRPAEFFTEKQIDLRVNTTATGVDTEAKTIALADGATLAYEQLIIATGLRPRRLPGLPELPGVHVLRGHDDALGLRSELGRSNGALVVGAGFIGCELAASFRASGLPVVLVEPQATPLAGVLGEQVGSLVGRLHRSEGVDLRCGVGVDTLLSGDTGVRGAVLSNGVEVPADVVVIGVGSRPVTEWLDGSGIDLAEPSAGGGVLADASGRTNVADVWTVGDVAAWQHANGAWTRVEHWTSAGEQARVVACALLGVDPPRAAQVPYFWSDQYEIKIQALGTPRPSDDVRIIADDGRKFLAYYSCAERLTGVVGAGMAGQVMKTRSKVADGAPVAELLGAAT